MYLHHLLSPEFGDSVAASTERLVDGNRWQLASESSSTGCSD